MYAYLDDIVVLTYGSKAGRRWSAVRASDAPPLSGSLILRGE
jgi:hypothetical protein